MPREYRRALVSFIDVIGFAELVKSLKNDPDLAPRIHGILTILRSHIATRNTGILPELQGATPEPEAIFRAFSFSDCTVRVTLLDEIHTLKKAIGHELSVLAEKQLELVCLSAAPWQNFPILLRGGICVGDISMDPDPRSDEIVFGPAMVRAYELERDAAVYPRIVIDRELIKEADASRWVPIVEQGDDGFYFLNYLYGSVEFLAQHCSTGPEGSRRSLLNHRQTIRKTIQRLQHENKMDDRILQKYLWLIKYHNSIVYEMGESKYRIPEDIL